jgi:hypothetical protein
MPYQQLAYWYQPVKKKAKSFWGWFIDKSKNTTKPGKLDGSIACSTDAYVKPHVTCNM